MIELIGLQNWIRSWGHEGLIWPDDLKDSTKARGEKRGNEMEIS